MTSANEASFDTDPSTGQRHMYVPQLLERLAMAARAAAAAEKPALAHDAGVTVAGFRGRASSARSASITTSNATGLPALIGARRNAGKDSTV